MTLRNNKRLVLVAGVLVVIAAGLNAWQALRPGGAGWKDFTEVIPFLFFAILLGSLWQRLSKLEAEHGPDYVPPATPHARTLLLVLVGVGVALAVLATFLLLRKG